MTLPADYLERTYAGVLGKIIGVYLGRPVENWTYERIAAELGDVDYYVHDRLGVPLIVTDDDIAGTFAFLRALPDAGNSPAITSADVGDAWLNYLIEGRTVLWWGGLGNSTEHTAYLRLKDGVRPPRSGSAEVNGTVVAEQIGAQIFIDGWAMVAPGRPELAADLAERAARVSHDGEAVQAARVLAAMESAAYGEADVDRLLEIGLSVIPRDSVIAALARDVRAWHRAEPDWRTARARLEERYGYHVYGGNCHVVPNHGLILLALLYGDGDFDRSMAIVNTAGWDTDCNSGNLGCLLGIRGGLAGLAGGRDWRGPVADRLFLSSAEGGRSVSDALTETYAVVNIGRALAGLDPLVAKDGARFHFSLPGATQGFTVVQGDGEVRHADGSLAITATDSVVVTTPTFIPPEPVESATYPLLASPTLYPGQQVTARLTADLLPVRCSVVVRHYGAADEIVTVSGEPVDLDPGESKELTFDVPGLGGHPVAAVGLRVEGAGVVRLDRLGWSGAPRIALGRPAGGSMWRRAWVDAVDRFETTMPEPYRLIQNHGRGLAIQGTREWRDYTVRAIVTPHLASEAGLAIRVQGLRRYYAAVLTATGDLHLIKRHDGEEHVLATARMPWDLGRSYDLILAAHGADITVRLDGAVSLTAHDDVRPFEAGAIGLLCADGRVGFDHVSIDPGGHGHERVVESTTQRRPARRGPVIHDGAG